MSSDVTPVVFLCMACCENVSEGISRERQSGRICIKTYLAGFKEGDAVNYTAA